MAPPIATAKITLTYPLYASDFDPYNSSYILVGGGGGESRSGVGNKIVCQKSPVYVPPLTISIDPSRCFPKAESLGDSRHQPFTRRRLGDFVEHCTVH